MKTKLTSHSKYLRKLCMASLSAAMLIVQVHPAGAQTDQDMIEVARSIVAADRKAVVVAAMELTEKEGTNFWPLYDQYRNEMGKITDKRIKLVQDYAKLYPTVPDEQAKQMLDTYIRLQRKQVDKRAAYLKNFARILPPAKALRFAQVETRLDLFYQLQLAAAVPLTPLASENSAPASVPSEAITSEAGHAIEAFKSADTGLITLFNNSAGFAVFPSIGKGGLIFGGAYGKGLVYQNASPVGEATLTEVNFGAQVGGGAFYEVIFFETAESLANFKEGHFEMSAKVNAIAAAEGAALNAKYREGVIVFTLPRSGLMAQASIGGQKFSYKPLK
jgi:lipid-binding SYLF domain-containing protein